MNPLDIIIAFFDLINKYTSHKPRYYVHSRDRRNSKEYKKKRKIVKNVWSFTLVTILILLQLDSAIAAGIICALAFLTTFMCFAILDETK